MLRPIVLATAVAALCTLAPGDASAAPKHAYMHRALFEMREASKELREAPHNFGGHRDRAVAALDAAAMETEAALQAAGDPYEGFTPGEGVYEKYPNQPHLRHALAEMREAHKALGGAKHDFGGHRQKALGALDAAILHTEKCIQAIK